MREQQIDEGYEYVDEGGPTLPPYKNPMQQFGDSSIIAMTDPSKEIQELIQTLRSWRRLQNGKLIKCGEPLINEHGISSIVGIVQGIVSQTTIMSNLETKRDIPAMMEFIGDTLAKDLMINRVLYDIKSPSTRDKIFFVVLSKSFLCMKRAAQEAISDKKFWRGSVQEIHSRVEGPERKGMLQKIWPGR